MNDYLILALHITHLIRTRITQENAPGLGDRELQILEHITREHALGRFVFMEDGMSLKHLGSRYTLRKSIQVLIDLNYLQVDSTTDSRQRPLVPAPRAVALFEQIGKSISQLLVSQKPFEARPT